MDAIREIEKEGYLVTLQSGNIQIRKKLGFAPDANRVSLLLDQIRAHKSDAIAYLKLRDSVVFCPYKKQLRRVSWPACEWHREEEDPECYGCDSQERILH
jgi:hypothetical protein